MAAPIYILATAHKGSLCPHPHPRFPLIFLPITIVMTVRRYRIVVLSLMISDIEHLYVGLLVICVSSLEKCLFRSSAYFFNQDFLLLLSCMTSLYILDINLLSNTWFANIFSHSIGCLCILLMVSSAVQKLFSLMYFHCLFLLFVSASKNHYQGWCQRAYHLCFLLGDLWIQVLCSSL